MRTRALLALGGLLVALAACADPDSPSTMLGPAEPTEAAVCEMGGTEADVLAEIAALRAQVDALEASGALNAGQARALRNHLDNAQRALAEGNLCAAHASLRAFREQVMNFVADGVLSEGEAAPLLEGADRALGEARLIVEATVSAGSNHTCGLTTSGRAYCWGDNFEGALGDGTTTDRNTPVAVEAPPGVTFARISAGGLHTCALSTAGAAYCWGRNGSGRLGDGTTTNRLTPVAVDAPLGVSFAAISAGGGHTCGLTSAGLTTAAGEVSCWGINTHGQLGDGSTTQRHTPVAVEAPPGITFARISAGIEQTCGFSTAGEAYCWGSNARGQLGDGTTADRLTPVAVAHGPSGAITFVAISSWNASTCGVSTGEEAYCWGRNETGQLGDGATTDRHTPVAVEAPSGITFARISAGGLHTCALTTAGAAYCWGGNLFGELGDGTTTDRLTPVAVDAAPGVMFATIDGGGGLGHTCGLSTDELYCWGNNGSGQLGNSSTTHASSPVAVTGWSELP